MKLDIDDVFLQSSYDLQLAYLSSEFNVIILPDLTYELVYPNPSQMVNTVTLYTTVRTPLPTCSVLALLHCQSMQSFVEDQAIARNLAGDDSLSQFERAKASLSFHIHRLDILLSHIDILTAYLGAWRFHPHTCARAPYECVLTVLDFQQETYSAYYIDNLVRYALNTLRELFLQELLKPSTNVYE